MIYLIIAIITFVGWYLHTSRLAYRDGVRDNVTFNRVWWPMHKGNRHEQLGTYLYWHHLAEESKNAEEKKLLEHYATVAKNYIERSTGGQITIKRLD